MRKLAYSVKEAAAIGISEDKLRMESKAGSLRALKVGSRTVIPLYALECSLRHPSVEVGTGWGKNCLQELEEEAEVRGVSVSALLRESAMFLVGKQHVTMHVDAYVAMLDGVRRAGGIARSDAHGRGHLPSETRSDIEESQS